MPHRQHTENPESSCGGCQEAFRASISGWGTHNRSSFPWREPRGSAFELVLAEVLLQQTRAESVAEAFGEIIEHCVDWSTLEQIPLRDLETLLRPLGLHKRRAAVLKALAQRVNQAGLPTTAMTLQELPGIGQYMSRAIAAQLFSEVVAPVDTNVARVLERVFGPRQLADIRYDPYLQSLALALVPQSDPGGYLLDLLDFARTVCRPRSPRCQRCPMFACRFRSNALNSPASRTQSPA